MLEMPEISCQTEINALQRLLESVSGEDLDKWRVWGPDLDLHIRAKMDLREDARQSIIKNRRPLENYIKENPSFASSLKPVPVTNDAPPIVMEMARAAEKAGVGPMATVAGAIAQFVGEDLLKYSPEIMVENGGDIFLKIAKPRLVGVYAGEAPFTGRIALKVQPGETPLGICTSSGTVGHSLSFGRADAVVVLSPSTSLADAAATAIGNLVKEAGDIHRAIEFAQGIEDLRGILIIKGDNMGLWGGVTIVPHAS